MEKDVKMIAITKFGTGNPLVIIKAEQEFYATEQEAESFVSKHYAYRAKVEEVKVEPLKDKQVETKEKTTTKPVSKAKSKASTAKFKSKAK